MTQPSSFFRAAVGVCAALLFAAGAHAAKPLVYCADASPEGIECEAGIASDALVVRDEISGNRG